MTENQKPPGRGSPPGTPRWVKIFIIIFIVLVVLVVILHLLGFGFGSHRISEMNNTRVVGMVDYTRLTSTSVDHPVKFIATHNLLRSRILQT